MKQRDAQDGRRFRHVFLDAEGTIYVPKHGRSRWEFWANPTPEAALEFFELDKGVREALVQLRERVDTLCIVSKNPKEILDALLEKFGIRHLFDDILLNENKGKLIAHYLYMKGFRREESVMVGDMPTLDLFPVRRLGIESLLVTRSYNSWAKAERISGVFELPSWLKIADLADKMGDERPYIASLDDFQTAEALKRTHRQAAQTSTKRLIAVQGT